MSTTTVEAEIDEATKKKAEEIMAKFAILPPDAIVMFYNFIATEEAMPFPVEMPNAETIAAIEAGRRGDDTSFNSVEELMADLNAEDSIARAISSAIIDGSKATPRYRNIDRLLAGIIEDLANDQPLPISNRDHALTGKWIGLRECHVQPDLLLVYDKPGREKKGFLFLVFGNIEISLLVARVREARERHVREPAPRSKVERTNRGLNQRCPKGS